MTTYSVLGKKVSKAEYDRLTKKNKELRAKAKRKTVAIAVGKDKSGKTVTKNLNVLGEKNVKELSKMTDKYGRLTVSNVKETTTPSGGTKTSVEVYAKTKTPTTTEAIVYDRSRSSTASAIWNSVYRDKYSVRNIVNNPGKVDYTQTKGQRAVSYVKSLGRDAAQGFAYSGQLEAKAKFKARKTLSREEYDKWRSEYKTLRDQYRKDRQPVPLTWNEYYNKKLSERGREIALNTYNVEKAKITLTKDDVKDVNRFSARAKAMYDDPYKDQKQQFAGQVALFAGTAPVVGAAAPRLLTALEVGFAGKAGVRYFKDPSPERFVDVALMSTPLLPKAARAVKRGYVKFGSEYVAPEKVFSEQVLSGKKTLPTSKSVDDSLMKFRESDYVVSTSSPQKLKGDVAGVGKKASTGFEDPGIYVTPKGEGSPFFLRVAGANSGYGFTLNPFKPFQGVFKVPTVSEFATTGVFRLPKKVTDAPGFTAVKAFQEGQAGSGRVFITKRSQIGQGELKPQVNPQTRKLEAGTNELEAVIPVGQGFEFTPKTAIGKLKGFDKYTVFNGEVVAIREGSLIVGKKGSVAGDSVFVSGKRLQKEASYLEYYNPKKTSNLISSAFYANRGYSNVYRPSVYVDTASVVRNTSYKNTLSKVGSLSYTSNPQVSRPVASSSRPSRSRPSRSSSRITYTQESSFVRSPTPSDPRPIPSYPRPGRGSSPSRVPTPVYDRDFIKTPTYRPTIRNNSKGSSPFTIEVREKGVFKRIKGNFSDLRSAYRGGKTAVGSRAAASFRIVDLRSDKVVSGLGSGDRTIRLSKSEFGVYVERLGKRIKSGGELKEITYQGLLTLKRKKKKTSVFGGGDF